MNDDFEDCVKVFDQAIRDANNLSFITRDDELQRAQIENLSKLAVSLKGWKQEAIAGKNEDRANQLLGMECLAKAINSELEMWRLLKISKPDDAWIELVAAQTKTTHAIRAHKRFSHLDAHAHYLDLVEKVVFPSQVFLSAGLIVHQQICSICNSDYEDCTHLVGMPYWGEFCFRHLTNVTPNHIAIVKEPANKCCRVTNFNVEGGKRNRMTWRIENVEAPPEQVEGQTGLKVEAIILSKNDLLS